LQSASSRSLCSRTRESAREGAEIRAPRIRLPRPLPVARPLPMPRKQPRGVRPPTRPHQGSGPEDDLEGALTPPRARSIGSKRQPPVREDLKESLDERPYQEEESPDSEKRSVEEDKPSQRSSVLRSLDEQCDHSDKQPGKKGGDERDPQVLADSFHHHLTRPRISTNGYQVIGRHRDETERITMTSPAWRSARNASGATRFHGISTPSPSTLSPQPVHAPPCSRSRGQAHHAQDGNNLMSSNADPGQTIPVSQARWPPLILQG